MVARNWGTLKRAVLNDIYRDNLALERAASHVRGDRTTMRGRGRWSARVGKLLAILPLFTIVPQALAPSPAPAAVARPATEIHDAAHPEPDTGSTSHFPWPEDYSALNVSMRMLPASAQEPLSPPAGNEAYASSGAIMPAAPDANNTWFNGYAALLDNKVSLAGLFGLDVKTIVIDAGHGGYDPGAIGAGGLEEKTVNLAVAKSVRRRLQALGYHVLMTRDDDEYVSLKQRVNFANTHHADLFISIHVNSLPQKDAVLVETFHFGPSTDQATLKLAHAENRGSDYTIGDFHKMIARIEDTFKRRQSRALATLIQANLYRNMNRQDPDVTNAGIRTAPFVVLLGTKMPSVLVEISCISNLREEQRLATPAYRERIASAVTDGIEAYLRSRQPGTEPLKGVEHYAGKTANRAG